MDATIDYITHKYQPNEDIPHEQFIVAVQSCYIIKPKEQVPLFGIQHQTQLCEQICANREEYRSGSVCLLLGVPGSGKTRMIMNIATKHPQIKFFHLHITQLVSEVKRRGIDIIPILFDMLKFYYPSVLLLDEFEDLNEEYHTFVLEAILKQLESLKKYNNQIPVIISENAISKMVAAFPNISKAIFIPPPNHQARTSILRQLCKASSFIEPINYEKIALELQGFTGSDIGVFVRDSAYEPIRKIVNENNGDFSPLTNLPPTIYASEADLIKCLAHARPSISEEEVQNLYNDYLLYN